MAVAGKLKKLPRAPWHPMAMSDTPMEPNVLLAAKLAFVFLVADGFFLHLGTPFAPALPSLGALRSVPGWAVLLPVLFWVPGLCLLVNRFVRPASTILGAVVLLAQLQSSPALANHSLFLGALLVLAGLEQAGRRPVLLRWQMAAIHLVMFIGKVGDPAWRDGDVLAGWIRLGEAVNPALAWLGQGTSVTWLGFVLSWAVMGAELLLAVGLALPFRRSTTVWFGVLTQLALLVLLPSGPMVAWSLALALGYLAFLNWPESPICALWPRACGWPLWLHIALDRYDWDHRITWPMPPNPDAELEVDYDEVHRHDWHALRDLLLYFPAFHAVVFAVLLAAYVLAPAGVAATLIALVVGPLFAFCATPAVARLFKHAGGLKAA